MKKTNKPIFKWDMDWRGLRPWESNTTIILLNKHSIKLPNKYYPFTHILVQLSH